jgi:Cof subfamily protein (haloacid dehalogenase superfamily)
LVTDVDGTLLDHQSKLTDLNKRAIKDCINAGIKVVIATGKSFSAVEHLIKEFNLQLPQITLGGAMTVTPDGKVIDSFTIPEKIYHEIIDAVRAKGYEPLIATVEGKIYYQKFVPEMKNVMEIGETLYEADNIKKDIYAKHSVSIFLSITADDPLDSYIRKEFGKRMLISRSGKYFFDILNIKASKGNSLKKLIKRLKISKEEVISFGDSQNDISLFKESGFSIAVKNSYPELIELADAITDENHKSGLGKAIYKYILHKTVSTEAEF